MAGGGCEEALGCGTVGAGNRGVFRPNTGKERALVRMAVVQAQASFKRTKWQSPTLLNVVLGDKGGTGYGIVDKWLSTHILVCSSGPIASRCIRVRGRRGIGTSGRGSVASLGRVSILRVDLSTGLLDGLSWIFCRVIISAGGIGCVWWRRRETIRGWVVILCGLGIPGWRSPKGRRA